MIDMNRGGTGLGTTVMGGIVVVVLAGNAAGFTTSTGFLYPHYHLIPALEVSPAPFLLLIILEPQNQSALGLSSCDAHLSWSMPNLGLCRHLAYGI